jgi:hypothetical protein
VRIRTAEIDTDYKDVDGSPPTSPGTVNMEIGGTMTPRWSTDRRGYDPVGSRTVVPLIT